MTVSDGTVVGGVVIKPAPKAFRFFGQLDTLVVNLAYFDAFRQNRPLRLGVKEYAGVNVSCEGYSASGAFSQPAIRTRAARRKLINIRSVRYLLKYVLLIGFSYSPVIGLWRR
jgi:hypothetical protein